MPSTKQNTDEVLSSMMEEYTGRSMLDSGSAYGRHWEENEDGSYKEKSYVNLRMMGEYFLATINVYHFLRKRLKHAPELEDRFDSLKNLHPDMSWTNLMEEFPKSLQSVDFAGEVHGPMHQPEPQMVNTYNFGDCILSQTLQFCAFTITENPKHNGDYILLQIHNGCDVRGGYTAPRLFELRTPFEEFERDMRTFTLTDGPNSWTRRTHEGFVPHGDYPDLGDFDWVNVKDLWNSRENGYRKDKSVESDPELVELKSSLDYWEEKVEEHSDRLSPLLLEQHQHGVNEHKKQIWHRLRALTGEREILIAMDDQDLFDETALSPMNGNPITAKA